MAKIKPVEGDHDNVKQKKLHDNVEKKGNMVRIKQDRGI